MSNARRTMATRLMKSNAIRFHKQDTQWGCLLLRGGRKGEGERRPTNKGMEGRRPISKGGGRE